MRILFVALPAYGLSLPLVPLAWAARSAGHEILFASANPMAKVLAEAGLPVVDAFPAQDIWLDFTRLAQNEETAEMPDDVRRLVRSKNSYGYVALTTAEPTVRAGRDFGADLVVFASDHGGGPSVAAKLGVPALEVGNRMAWAMRDREFREKPSILTDGVIGELLGSRLGLAGPAPVSLAGIDLRAPSIGGLTGTEADEVDGKPWWPMQCLPYNGGVVVPGWALAAPTRPRVLVTLGTTVPLLTGVSGLSVVLDALSTMDLDVVLAGGSADLTELGTLPANVTSAGFLPFSTILPRCSLMIHHGGAGTIAAALAYGVPQFVLPAYGENRTSADQLTERGVALQADPEQVTAELLRDTVQRLLGEPAFAKVAREVAREIAEMPSPASTIAKVEHRMREMAR
ncbi:nucleotide disphospho-sugar-binding domain-containing protein [Amycolatopsis sp.]|uniref:nucleotide disphospho-sugar-binding domain-containing protein n=1 Tax=Amycolatopsis sp. TaxID=37632 RepID=UPI002D807B2E|nr:nucleotide disphospho-sugar-binding domain-containing protein [Amycolatopsis sp.]HET6705053.1 nucleotide disphospho-sugar-binding domain-containing protein [Amycolatopsis sp.]